MLVTASERQGGVALGADANKVLVFTARHRMSVLDGGKTNKHIT
jgi:hypothetical protein